MEAPGSSRVAGCRGDQPLLVLPPPHERGARRALVLHALPPPPDGVRPVMVMARLSYKGAVAGKWRARRIIQAPWLANGCLIQARGMAQPGCAVPPGRAPLPPQPQVAAARGAQTIHTHVRVRVEIMGSQKCRIVGESQPALMMIRARTPRSWR
eukprot:COSAG01_NODE_3078_length_6628_cov_30.180885_5_plen_154_part_00